jgi:hypothetical protein
MVIHFACRNKLLNLALGAIAGREPVMSAWNAVLAEPTPSTQSNTSILRDRLFRTRTLSTEIARPLSDEDQVVQVMDDASPTKWHLAHTTWFFEAFLLKRFLPGYQVFDERFEYCFNSY